MIVQSLYDIQQRHGYLPRAELLALADRLAIPLYRIQQVVSFFPHYRTELPPRVEVHVCETLACQLYGGDQLLQNLQAANPASAQQIKVCGVPCLGRCDRAPAARVYHNPPNIEADQHNGQAHDDADHGHQIYNMHAQPGQTVRQQQVRIQAAIDAVLANAAHTTIANDTDIAWSSGSPASADWQINEIYRQASNVAGRYQAVRRFAAICRDEAATMAEEQNAAPKSDKDQRAEPPAAAEPRTRRGAADRVIKVLETAALHGMGGPGARAFKKWEEVRIQEQELKFVVCNADESEPGTFKDRELLLRTPHLVVEGVILAGLVVRATRGYIYIRHEFEEQVAAVRREIEAARAAGLCGENILGSGSSFEVEVFVSPGGYICGEQTAMVQAIQDERAEPRNRPPELQTNGLWDLPTLLSNVETFAWAPSVVLRDEGRWYAQSGAPQSAGTRFFSVSGDVKRPGVYEVPIGITLRALIERCGGMRDAEFRAVALSGPSGGFLSGQITCGEQTVPTLDLRLDVNVCRNLRIALGAGITIYDTHANLVEQALCSVKFYQQESCGKCVPCRIGSTKIAELTALLANRALTLAEIQKLMNPGEQIADLAVAMAETAICGLGQVAANPLTSLLKFFPGDVAAYAKDAVAQRAS